MHLFTLILCIFTLAFIDSWGEPVRQKEVRELNNCFKALSLRHDMNLTVKPLNYHYGNFEFLRLASNSIHPSDPVLLIAAGVHGDERSGPLTLALHGDDIIDQAHSRGIKLIIYPLRNPSGYASGRRYNIDNDMGEGGNNDFGRYLLSNNCVVDSLPSPNTPYSKFLWASDPSLKLKLPLETQVMHQLLRKDPISQLAAAIDLHQDFLTPKTSPGSYHYTLANPQNYNDIVKRIDSICPVLKNTVIGAGFGTQIDNQGNIVGEPEVHLAPASDEWGFIIRHDGTLSDLLFRLGVPHSLTAETTGATPMNTAIEVNRIWIEGLQDLILK